MRSLFLLITLALLLPASTTSMTAAKPLELSYRLAFPQPHTHLYEVTFTIGNVVSPQLDLQMPVWTPGSYLIREFARNVQDFEAKDAGGERLTWQKIDKSTWRVEAGASSERPKTIAVSYRVYANELSVRTSHLDSSHAYFNGASIFMYVKDALALPLKLRIDAPEGWRVTTPLGLEPDPETGFYTAPNYDTLVDSPTEVGKHKLLEFTVRGKTHRIAIWGDGAYDPERLKVEFGKIVEEGARMFGSLPYEHYTFFLHIQPEAGGGLEHLNSTTCQIQPRAFATRRGYRKFLGTVAHEYFHLWNVKRIRPIALGPFDYQHENYTHGLWLAEGTTEYYSGQLLRRAGLISTPEYLDELATLIHSYESTPGRLEQTAESASFDSWIKFYRPDENSLNSSMSYYDRGALLGWLLDLEIRTRTGGAKNLDDVMRLLLDNYGLPKPGFTDAGLKAAFEKVAGADLTDFFQRYVNGNDEIDFNAYLSQAGLRLIRGYQPGTAYADNKDEKPGTLGLRTRLNGDRVVAAAVIAGLPSYVGGINAGDELVALDGNRIAAGSINVLEELRAGQKVRLTVFRRERLMTFDLTAAVRP
ncbi:MAG: M61 family metallopeptidase, partial [Blastocatellia bacterium]|nr:M61 family metallopeptidase [Blastocatellia bacterium]